MAKKFKFNLQSVLRYREIQEDQQKRAFALANQACEEERLKRESIQTERDEILQSIVRLYAEQADFNIIADSYQHASFLEQKIKYSLHKQKSLDFALEKQRQLLVGARKNTRVMEILKDYRKEEFNKEQDKLEQNFLDELAVQAKQRLLINKDENK